MRARHINSTCPPYRIVIIGAGYMGHFHIKTCLSEKSCILSAIVDTNPNIQKNHLPKCRFYTDVKLLPHSFIDAAIIATPPDTHAEIAIPLLKSGIHCLVEKPLSLNSHEIRLMNTAARKGGAVLAVGHTERFHSPFNIIKKSFQKNTVISIKRTNKTTAQRNLYGDVIEDLLIHDVDWMLTTFKHQPQNIKIHDLSLSNNFISSVNCEFLFKKGITVNIFANRLAKYRERTLTINNKNSTKQINRLKHKTVKDPLSKQLISFFSAISGNYSIIARAQDASKAFKVLSIVKHKCHKLI